MISTGSLAIGLATMVVLGGYLVRRLRRGREPTEVTESRRRHEEAQRREPPVELGESYVAGIEDFSEHHSGAEHAVCRVEGFVVFVEDLPGSVEVGDVIRFKILSYNRGHTSASAMFLGRS